MDKFLKIFKIVFGVLGGVLLIRILNADADLLEEDLALQQSLVTPLMYLAYIILGLCLITVIVFVLRGLFQGNIKKTLITVGSFVAIVIIAFLVSEGQETAMRDGEVLSEYGSRWVSAGLTTFYILIVLSIVAIFASSTRKLITSS
ncbi:hypothetical protein [Psychroflexus maritimus]|uniref:Uncharacterized protein n=1 Tax=Psychroflexus maritimus TaxID=2714865 RepID=A0A967DXY6_9FLAO|nr:hypothetical protein [Psychroflexus maritimus]NGZ89225.1 hypothetical protein [Psychroflexus maritimus]